jgi:hypothetical protein
MSDLSGTDPFADIDPQMAGVGESKLKGDDPFADLNLPAVAHNASGIGSFFGHAASGVLPMAGGMAAAGAGAEAGAAIGALGGPFGSALGGIVGGLGGFFAGSAATEGAQDFAIHQMPDNWQESIGQSDRQKRMQEQQHPYASFLGGIAPYALTMSPGAFATRAAGLPADATAFQRLMANPLTARAMGGGMMGGLELGQEELNGESPDWVKIGVSTGFGMVFNKPTTFGEYLTHAGAAPIAVLRGKPPEPTVAQTGDLGVMGPGITESTFHGGTKPRSAPFPTLTPTPLRDGCTRNCSPRTTG